MTAIAFPAGVVPRSFSAMPQVNQRLFASPYGGSEQVVDLLNDRWLFSLELAPRLRADGAAIEAFVAALRGMGNTCALHHFARPVPRGTLVGSPTAQAAAQGAATLVLNTTTGYTLKAGDMLGVAGLLVQVAADCTAAAGAITVPLANRLRTAVTNGAAVTWSQPTANFRLVSQPRVLYVPGMAEAVAMDFAEVVA